MTVSVFLSILMGVLLNAVAQIFLKQGVSNLPGVFLSLQTLSFCLQNLYLWMGIICYMVSIVVWLFVLSQAPLSVAYPLLSMGYIVAAIAGHYFFNEPLNAQRFLGIFIIMIGVYFVSKSNS